MTTNNQFFDVLVAKEYETRQNGQVEKKVAWNKVGRAWLSKSSESLSFELFLLPNQRYVVHRQNNRPETNNENVKGE